MLEYTGASPAASQNPWSSLFKTIAILRIGSGVLLLTRHGWTAAVDASQFLWKEQPWDWVRFLADAGVPYPHLTAPVVALVVAAVAVCWTVGFLTRFFAVLFLPVVVGALFLAEKAASPLAEAAWLYLLVSVTLVLFGSGAVSIDGLFRLGERWSRPKPRKGW